MRGWLSEESEEHKATYFFSTKDAQRKTQRAQRLDVDYAPIQKARRPYEQVKGWHIFFYKQQ